MLVDVEPDTFNINVEAIKKAITPKTKAIVPVHLFGQCANMDAIMQLAEENNLFVIEDNAQAIGATYIHNNGNKSKAGTIGHIGTTSFFPSKNLGCYGDGGAIFTNNDELAHTLRGIVNHGMYERYHHDVVGVNSRLDSIQAAVLSAKLPNLDSYCKARENAANAYDKAFESSSKIIAPYRNSKSTSHVFHQYTLKLKGVDRNALVKYLNECSIPCGVYYPIPLHKQKAYTDTRYNEADFSVTNQLVKEVISLPMHTELDKEQIDFITEKVINFINK